MGNEKPKQFNVNSLIGVICAALVGLAIQKLDHLNTSSIAQDKDITAIKEHVTQIDARVAQFVIRSELQSELSTRDSKMADMQKQIDYLRRAVKPQNP
jgi:hypothetical protein